MALRLLRAYLPFHDAKVELELRGRTEVEVVSIDERTDTTVAEIVVSMEEAEGVVQLLEKHFGHHDDFKVLIFALEATVPTIKQEQEQEQEPERTGPKLPPLNVEELYESVRDHAELDWGFVISVVIAACVAAAGMLRDSAELVVASMILAPLLGPSIALATATTLGDPKLALRAIRVAAVGVALSFLVGAIMGAIFGVPLEARLVTSRMQVGVLEFIVAGCAGVAAALSFTSDAFDRVVGVMVAVALLPPMVLTGMLLGTLDFTAAVSPALVTAINLIAINLCSVVVLFLQNVRPRNMYEQERAGTAVRWSVVIWSVTLAVFIGLVLFARAQGVA